MFPNQIAEPAGILAFLPYSPSHLADFADDEDDDKGPQFPGVLAVPSEYHSRAVLVRQSF